MSKDTNRPNLKAKNLQFNDNLMRSGTLKALIDITPEVKISRIRSSKTEDYEYRVTINENPAIVGKELKDYLKIKATACSLNLTWINDNHFIINSN